MTAIVMVDGIAYTRKEGIPCYDSGLGWRECQSDESHVAGALVDAHDTIATLRAQLAAAREELRVSRLVANDGFKYWDNDQDSKAGKMLLALSGVDGIRVDLDTTRAALATLGGAPERRTITREELGDAMRRISLNTGFSSYALALDIAAAWRLTVEDA